ncbi:MAG: hypothetical protein ACP59X_10995 [Solidesulfovibrio sp. DCME]|uniref:hypothetical protein n=1 Tax=Solidesulfovibrio sp. DCME TaxID=3447380 RepID=UPI003D0DEA52
MNSVEEIHNAAALDFSSRHQTPQLQQFIVLRNVNGYFAAVQIVTVTDTMRGDQKDELCFRYWILNDGTADFSVI